MHVERMAERRLGGQQTKMPPPVVAQYELGPTGAERAIAVENDERTMVGKFRNEWIPTVRIRRAHRRVDRSAPDRRSSPHWALLSTMRNIPFNR